MILPLPRREDCVTCSAALGERRCMAFKQAWSWEAPEIPRSLSTGERNPRIFDLTHKDAERRRKRESREGTAKNSPEFSAPRAAEAGLVPSWQSRTPARSRENQEVLLKCGAHFGTGFEANLIKRRTSKGPSPLQLKESSVAIYRKACRSIHQWSYFI